MITEITIKDKTTLLACAYDTRGLNYALYELAERINAQSLPALYQPSQERPLLKRRGVVHFLSVEELKKGWNFSPTYWQGYFDLLIRKRFNSITLALEAPSFISTLLYLVDLPEHPEVQPPPFSSPSRQKNLEALQHFVELATEAGLDLYLGCWNYPGNTNLAEIYYGLNQENIESYLFLALKQLLFSCPELKGLEVKFTEGPLSADFCSNTIGRAISETGNNLTLKLDSAQTTPELFNLLEEMEIKIILINNCWGKQFGLPYLRTLPNYFPPATATNYQLYSATSLRWGDPDYVRQLLHALNASLISGLDLIPPGLDRSGQEWCVQDASPENYERHWFFYHLFGRLAYNLRTAGDVLVREFHRRFGEKGNALVELYQLISKVVPLFNIIHQHQEPTPEQYTGGLLDYYLRIPVSDPVFFATIPEYTRTVTAGVTTDKISPATIAASLRQLGEEISHQVATLRDDSPQRDGVFLQEWQETLAEAEHLANFAFYHSRKLEAAIELSFITETSDLTSLNKALNLLSSANRFWEKNIRSAEQIDETKTDYRLPAAAAQKRLLLLEDVKRVKALRDEYQLRGHFIIGFDFGGLPCLSAEDTQLTAVFPDFHIEQGFTAVDNRIVYDPEKGYGWLDPSALQVVSSPRARLLEEHFQFPAKNTSTAYENQLVADFVWSRKPATFRVDLNPGTYRLQLTLSDRSAEMRRHGPMKFVANETVLAEELIITAGQRVDLQHELTVEDGSLLVNFDCLPHQDWFISALSISPVGPLIAHTPLTAAVREEPLVISASVSGSHPLRQVILNFQTESEEGYHMLSMAPQTKNLYFATIPAPYLKESRYVKYYITAYDKQGHEAAMGSKQLPFTITMNTKDLTPSLFQFPPAVAPAEQDLTLKISPRPLEEVDKVILVYTGANEKEQQLTMERDPETEEYLGLIPGSFLHAEQLLRYRFIILFKDADVQLYPNPLQADPYFLVPLT
ncbi:MAG: hypothetical protein GX050_02165 [Firmicutes bacterium]|nr:hypothetical protein [Bacillota bacterium]